VRPLACMISAAVVLLACAPEDPLDVAKQRFEKGELVEGIEILRDLLDEGREDPELYYLYGQALAWSGQVGLAAWPLRKAMESPEWFEQAATAVAQIELAGANYENATDLLGSVIERNPDNIEARVARAKAFAQSPRHPEEALEEVEQILDIDPTELRAHESRILAYLTLEDEEAAREAFEELGARLDEQVEQGTADEWTPGWYCATMAIFAEDNQDLELARERWNECNEQYPAHANVVAKSIEFFDRRNEPERSLEIARAALDADPAPGSDYRETVSLYLRALDRRGEAESLLREAAESENSTASMKGNIALARFYEDGEAYESAVEALEAGLEIHDSAFGPSPDMQLWLGDLMIRANQDDRALALAEQMSVEAQAAMLRGRVAQRRGDHAAALDFYEDASRLWPDNPYAPYFAGHAATSLGRFGVALSSFRQAVRISPSATDASLQAARLSAAHGNWRSAADLIGQGQKDLSPESALFFVEVAGRLRGPDQILSTIQHNITNHPEIGGALVAAGAKGVGEQYGADAGWRSSSRVSRLPFRSSNRFHFSEVPFAGCQRERSSRSSSRGFRTSSRHTPNWRAYGPSRGFCSLARKRTSAQSRVFGARSRLIRTRRMLPSTWRA
jgi:tetratricopeptide (TPR) repeat protein